MKKWGKNQNEVENREVEFFKKQLLDQFQHSKRDNLIQIDVFDRNMSRLGLDISSIDSKLKKNSKVQISSEMLMQKIKEKLETNKQARKEKDRRQRKIFYEQNKAQQELEKASKLKTLENENFDFNNKNTMLNIVNSEEVKYEIDKQPTSVLKQKEFERWRYIHDRKMKVFLRNENFFHKLEVLNPYDETKAENFNFQRSQLDNSIVEFNREQFYDELNNLNLDWFKKQIEKKKRRKAEDFCLLSEMIDSIIDLVDVSYEYQIKNDNELINVDIWEGWMNSFINNIPIKDKYFVKEKKEEDFVDRQDPFITELNRFGKYEDTINERTVSLMLNNDEVKNLFYNEEAELFDYLFYSGKWKDTLFEENPYARERLKVTDVVNEKELISTLGLKASYIKILEKDIELKDDHIEYLTIPNELIYNYYFTEMLEALLELKYIHFPLFKDINVFNSNVISNTPVVYDADQRFKIKSSILSGITVKVALTGHKFAGKKSVCKLITESYPWMKAYSIIDILNNYFEILKKIETPIESHPKFKTLKKPQIEQLMKDKEVEEQKIAHIKEVIVSLKQQKDCNERLDDERLVDLLIEAIVEDFKLNQNQNNNNFNNNTESIVSPTNLQNNQLLNSLAQQGYSQQYLEDQIQKNKRKAEIQEELNKIKEEQAKKAKTKQKEEQQLIAELNKLNSTSYSGFILVDFPSTVKQAKLLEQKLSNFIPEVERPLNEYYKAKQDLSLYYQKIVKQSFIKPKATSVLNKVIYLDCDDEECVRRSVLRRIDPNTGTIYHLEDNPPPSNDAKLNDRLKALDDPETSEETIKKFNYEFDFEYESLEDFYSIFKFYSDLENKQNANTNAANYNEKNQFNNRKLMSSSNINPNTRESAKSVVKIKDDKEAMSSYNNTMLLDNNNTSKKAQSQLVKVSYLNPVFFNQGNESTINDGLSVVNNDTQKESNNQTQTKSVNKKIKNKVSKDKEESKNVISKYKTREKVCQEICFVIDKIIEQFEEKEQEIIRQYMNDKDKVTGNVNTNFNNNLGSIGKLLFI